MHYIISYILILVSYVHVCYHTVEDKRARAMETITYTGLMIDISVVVY